ncbi:MAG: RNA 2',3'-cyclic phosphodiesterase [Xanthomonadales bacterium]|nr:RNA 2',3'-cyclic phosphodiesterase [Xanthomonadales bacterium]
MSREPPRESPRESPRHRLFFALQPDRETARLIGSVQDQLVAVLNAGKVRRVPPERLHVTLLFLGNQGEEQLGHLVTIASQLEFAPCRLVLDHVGYFLGAGVAWLGGHETPPQLLEFQERLTMNVAEAGIEFDGRPWKPHITLYRNLRTRPETIDFKPMNWHIQDFILMESVQGRAGLRYVARGRWPLSSRSPGSKETEFV